MLALLSIAGKGLAVAAGNILATAVSEKVMKKIMIILIDKLISGAKTKTDDKVWNAIKKEIEK